MLPFDIGTVRHGSRFCVPWISNQRGHSCQVGDRHQVLWTQPILALMAVELSTSKLTHVIKTKIMFNVLKHTCTSKIITMKIKYFHHITYLHNDISFLIVSILDIQIPPLAELVVRTDFNLPRITAMSTCDNARSCQIWELVVYT